MTSDQPTQGELDAQFEQVAADTVQKAEHRLAEGAVGAANFQPELWRGVLAANGAGLVAAASLLSVDDYPSLPVKMAATAFFFGLWGGATAWAVGLGFDYWFAPFAARVKTLTSNIIAWREELRSNPDMTDRLVRIRRGNVWVRRLQANNRMMRFVVQVRDAIPNVVAASIILFLLGAATLVAGVIAFDGGTDPIVEIKVR